MQAFNIEKIYWLPILPNKLISGCNDQGPVRKEKLFKLF